MDSVYLATLKSSNDSTGATEENSYYPLGLRHDINILSVNNSSYKYQYNGKELQTETGWNDYGARMYISDIARWGVIDPLSETSRRFSPYNYAYDNSISFVDPDGRKAMAPNNWVWNNPMGGALGYMIGGGSATFGSFSEFLGEENPLAKFNNRETGGGAGLSSFAGTEASYAEVMNFLGISQPTYFQDIDFSQFMDITPQLAGVYAHRAMADYFNNDPLLNNNWFSEKKGAIWKWDMSWRADLQYRDNGVNAMWELKPISNFISSSVNGKAQVKFYADMHSYIENKKFHVGSSGGAPIPPINGQVVTDRSGYRFSYIVPIGTDGMIYYKCLNCESRRPEPVTQPQTNPQTVNQTGTALAIALLVLNIAVRLIPN